MKSVARANQLPVTRL